jgi:cell division protein ZapD
LKDLTLYEFPLNERVRLFIRLEHLFHQFDHFMQGRSTWDCRAVVSTLIDIAGVFGRNDLKSEALQEIDRQAGVLNRMSKLYEGVDQDMVQQVIGRLEGISRDLYAFSGKVGLSLMENELFKGITQRSSMPGGSCSFDLPAYHHWLEGDEAQRRQDLETWIQPFLQVRSAIDLLLNFIRTSANPVQEMAASGFYQKTLDHTLSYQLLRVAVPRYEPYYAEVSGGKHRFTIRFMLRDSVLRPVQTAEDIDFLLTCCLF